MTWWSDVPTRFSLMAGLSSPRTSFWEAVVNSGRPAMGRYSWLRLGSLRSLSSAYMDVLSAYSVDCEGGSRIHEIPGYREVKEK
jgi:hypothetical protein